MANKVPVKAFIVESSEFSSHQHRMKLAQSEGGGGKHNGNLAFSAQYKNGEKGKEEAVSYWRLYFFLQYYLCFTPFRFAKVSNQERQKGVGQNGIDYNSFRTGGRGAFVPYTPPDSYTTRSFFLHKFVCAVTNIAAIFGILGELRLSLPSDSSNPTLYFQFAQTMAFSIGKYLILKRYWKDKQRYLDLLNHIMSSELGKLPSGASFWRKLISSRYTYAFMVLTYFINEVGYYIVGLDGGTKDRSTVKLTVWEQMIKDAKFNFLFYEDDGAGDLNSTLAEATSGGGNGHDIVEVLLGILACLGYFQRIVLGSFDNMYVLGAVLTTWTLTTSFISSWEEEHGIQDGHWSANQIKKVRDVEMQMGAPDWWPTFLDRYRMLRQATDEINSIFGVNIAMNLVETVVFFAVAFQSIFSELANGKTNIVRMIIAVIVVFVIVACCVLSADVVHKMKNVRYWLNSPENRRLIPKEELRFVLDDLDSNNVSVKASNIYPITYNLLSSMGATSITYFIICVQLS